VNGERFDRSECEIEAYNRYGFFYSYVVDVSRDTVTEDQRKPAYVAPMQLDLRKFRGQTVVKATIKSVLASAAFMCLSAMAFAANIDNLTGSTYPVVDGEASTLDQVKRIISDATIVQLARDIKQCEGILSDLKNLSLDNFVKPDISVNDLEDKKLDFLRSACSSYHSGNSPNNYNDRNLPPSIGADKDGKQKRSLADVLGLEKDSLPTSNIAHYPNVRIYHLNIDNAKKGEGHNYVLTGGPFTSWNDAGGSVVTLVETFGINTKNCTIDPIGQVSNFYLSENDAQLHYDGIIRIRDRYYLATANVFTQSRNGTASASDRHRLSITDGNFIVFTKKKTRNTSVACHFVSY